MGSDLLGPKSSRHQDAIDKFLRNAKHILYKSSNLGLRLEQKGLRTKATQVMWGAEVSEAKNFPSKKDQIVSHRGCTPLYRNDLIIDAFIKFLNITSNSSASLIILEGNQTDPEHLKNLKKIVCDNDVEDRVCFVSKLKQNDVLKLFQESKIAVSMPLSDGYPNSIFETYSSKCWHIVPRFSQYMDVPGVVNGLLFSEETIEAIASQMAYGLSNEFNSSFNFKVFNENEVSQLRKKLSNNFTMN